MKKITVILLLSIYSLSIFGVSLKQFYCCGKLKSTTVTISETGKEKCSKGDSDDGCCKTKYQVFKVKDIHLATGYTSTPVKHFTGLIFFHSSSEAVSFTPQRTHTINGSHAPPIYPGVPIYISNCVYRI